MPLFRKRQGLYRGYGFEMRPQTVWGTPSKQKLLKVLTKFLDKEEAEALLERYDFHLEVQVSDRATAVKVQTELSKIGEFLFDGYDMGYVYLPSQKRYRECQPICSTCGLTRVYKESEDPLGDFIEVQPNGKESKDKPVWRCRSCSSDDLVFPPSTSQATKEISAYEKALKRFA